MLFTRSAAKYKIYVYTRPDFQFQINADYLI